MSRQTGRMRWIATVAVVGGLALAGCGTSGGDDTAPAPGPTLATTVEPGVSTTTEAADASGADPDPAEVEAAARYTELVERPNCLVNAFYAAADDLPANTTTEDAMTVLQPKAAEIVEAYDEFAAGLDERPWPADAQDAATAVAAQLREEGELFERIATAADGDAFLAAFDDLVDFGGERDDANALRDALGLDPVPVDGVDCSQAA